MFEQQPMPRQATPERPRARERAATPADHGAAAETPTPRRAATQFGGLDDLLTAAVQRRAMLQRDVAGDLDVGWTALKTASSYQGNVITQLPLYTQGITALDRGNDVARKGYAQQMAAGFAAWGKNYYNKTQAYLWEGELAAQNTDPYGNPAKFGVLGVDTDSEPDLTVLSHSPHPTIANTVVTDRMSVEVKASTSERYASFDGLVAGGMAQLRKRQNTGLNTSLRLMIHNDAPANHWPFTDNDFAMRFAGDFNRVTATDWNGRLAQRMLALKQTKGINLPVLVEAYVGGQLYATANV